MNALSASFRQTLGSLRLIGLLYGITLVLGLLVALPFYNTLNVEDQNSLAFLNLLGGFNYTVFSDFMHRSARSISPLMSVGRWLGILYVFLSVFFAGGILWWVSQRDRAQPTEPFRGGAFLSACSQYVGWFMRLFGVTLLFVLVGAGIWLVIGTLVTLALNDSFTERGLFWIGLTFFALFALTATLLLCIGDYAKVIMFRENERGAFRAYGRAGRLVLRNPGKTYGIYWLLIALGTVLFGVYFLLDDLITMSGWVTILLMGLIQQALVFARTGLKVWSLAAADAVYTTLPKPAPVLPPALIEKPIYEQETTPHTEPNEDQPEQTTV